MQNDRYGQITLPAPAQEGGFSITLIATFLNIGNL
jgi:hypothetical protein